MRPSAVRAGQAAGASGRAAAAPGHQGSAALRTLVAVVAVSVVLSILAGDWIAGLAIWVLAGIWVTLRPPEGPPVLAMALTFQWIQVTAGVNYAALTGRVLPAMDRSDYRTMVLLGLGCVVALGAGLAVGTRLSWGRARVGDQSLDAFGWPTLVAFHASATFLTGAVQELARRIPGITQAVLALTYVRFATLFIIVWRLTHPRVRWAWLGFVLGAEVVLGFTGFFAGFREPLMMAAIALLSGFDRRRWRHWVVLVGLLGIMAFTGLLWMSIRTDYRQDLENQVFVESREARLERVYALTSEWVRQDLGDFAGDMDLFVDRLWAVYYPALAVQRVPGILPHENGALLAQALWHILSPRILTPDKGVLESDSEMVRRYAGLWVAGPEKNTSIAFGYAGEAYVDFGVPLMFAPVFAYGLLMGLAYRAWLRLIAHRELAIALVSVIFWLGLYLFERSWIKTLGLSVTLMVYLGGATLLLDRVLLTRSHREGRARRRPGVASAPPGAPS